MGWQGWLLKVPNGMVDLGAPRRAARRNAARAQRVMWRLLQRVRTPKGAIWVVWS